MNYYTILGANTNDSFDVIKTKYRKLALKSHPDKLTNLPPDEQKKQTDFFALITVAFGVLQDPIKRKVYDEKGLNGLEKYLEKLKHEESINEARERNNEKKKERLMRQQHKELEKKLKQEQLEREQKLKQLELERLEKERSTAEKIKQQSNLERLRKKKMEIEQREKLLAEKRQGEIELENKIKQEKYELENKKKQTVLNLKIKNKNECLKHLNEFIIPFKNIILQNDNIDIPDIETYIINNIIMKTLEIIIESDEQNIKILYLELRRITDYYEQDNINKTREKLMLQSFLNKCSEYDIDKYIIDKYKDYLIQKKLYDTIRFNFLEQISGVFIKLIITIIPNIHYV